jgi:hypothetical protein
MFFVGTFVIIVSVLCLQLFMKYASLTNVTWDNTLVAIWSTIELNVGMICTSLPTLRLLAVWVWPVLNGLIICSRFGYSGSRYGWSKYSKRSTDVSISRDGPLRMNSLKISDAKVDAFLMPLSRVLDIGLWLAAPEPALYRLSRSNSEVYLVSMFTSRHKMYKYSMSVPIWSASMVRREFFQEMSDTLSASGVITRTPNDNLAVEDSVIVRFGRIGNSMIGRIVEIYAIMLSLMEYSMLLLYPDWPLNEPDNIPLLRGWLLE